MTWVKSHEEWEVERARLRVDGSRWMQLGPGEKVDVGDRYEQGWASGDILVGYTVIAGDGYSLHLVREIFDGYVYVVDADMACGGMHAWLQFMRYPAELLVDPPPDGQDLRDLAARCSHETHGYSMPVAPGSEVAAIRARLDELEECCASYSRSLANLKSELPR